MAYTIEQLNALDAAIAEGALIVQYSDKKVEYRSLDDMLRIRGIIAGELGLAANKGGIVYPTFSKGYSCQ